MGFRLRFAFFFAFVIPMAAQTFRGEIKGSVVDPSGATLGDAIVKAANTATGFSRSVATGSAGEFSLPDLPPGIYSVTAEKPGFQEQKSEVEVVVSRVATVDFHLTLASQASTVNVEAAATTIETSSTTLTGVVNTKEVTDLPMNGRDFRQMLKLSAGVSPATTSINGNRARGNNFQIDGADNNDGFQNASAVNQGGVAGIAGTLLPVEAIDQFSVATNGSAEMGRNGGGVVNMVIKSGTNATPRQRVLLQSQRILRRQHAFGRARFHGAQDSQSAGWILAGRTDNKEQARSSFSPANTRKQTLPTPPPSQHFLRIG